MTMTVYCAGPMTGLSYDEVFARYEHIRAALGPHFRVLHPMIGKDFLRNMEGPMKPTGYDHIASDQAIYNRDQWMVRQCDILFVDLRPGKGRVSIGTMFEMAWASILGKHVVLVIDEDWDVYDHAFVRMAQHATFHDIDEATAYMAKIPTGDI